MSPTFQAHTVDAGFGRKDEKPWKHIKWGDATKQTHPNERTSSERNI